MSQTNKCEFCNIEEVYPLYENKKIVKKGFLGNSTVKLISFCSFCAFYLQKNGYKDYFDIYIDQYERIISELSPDLKKLTPCKYCESESNITRKLHCSICDTDYCGLCPSIYSQDVMSDLMCPHCLFKNFYTPITKLLKQKSKQMSISDITAFINQDREEVKSCLELMYKLKMIDFAGDGRYFILSDKKKAAKTTSKKSDTTDVKAELKKYKQMLDEGLITQEQYDAKSNELLGL